MALFERTGQGQAKSRMPNAYPVTLKIQLSMLFSTVIGGCNTNTAPVGMTPDTMVAVMLSSKEAWMSVHLMVRKILSAKENFHINEDFLDCLGYLDCTHGCSGKTNRTQQASLMRTIHKMSKS
nr:unnamed protein product [Callosobruchus chinensis]